MDINETHQKFVELTDSMHRSDLTKSMLQSMEQARVSNPSVASDIQQIYREFVDLLNKHRQTADAWLQSAVDEPSAQRAIEGINKMAQQLQDAYSFYQEKYGKLKILVNRVAQNAETIIDQTFKKKGNKLGVAHDPVKQTNHLAQRIADTRGVG